MSKKQIGAALGALILAVAAPLFTLALLHGAGGTAEAQAPDHYTKVSVPDFGQHSTGWCWVGAAANSFWWYAHNTTGQDGLLGGALHPWEATEPLSQQVGSICRGAPTSWYDANDIPQGFPQPLPNPPPIPGYRQVMSKIAQTTFMDANQDSFRQPAEQNYCYSEGVEEWDYLVGLGTYVNNFGSGLKVHSIINPARCLGPGPWGMKPVRKQPPSPTFNFLNPCGLDGVPNAEPVFDQAPGPPTFLNYQTELSGGQDVLLWMESTSLETAHVVTGVGYDTRNPLPGTVGTITISDPWTHSTCLDHDDCWPLQPLPPPPPPPVLPGLMPDHNNASGHAVGPYDVCTVTSAAPLVINCNGTIWTIPDMIFVSPLVVNKQVADVLLDDGSNYPQEGNQLTLLSKEPLARTSNYEYATTDPDFKYLKSTNVKVSVTSLDQNLGPDVPDDAYVSFLADVPVGCEGRWIPQASPGGFVDTLTTADTFTNPLDPMTQTGGTIIDPSDPHYIQKVPGDGDPNTIESDLHFQTADWELEEPVGGQLSLLRFFEFHCWEAGDKTFTFYNKIEPEPLDADVDPNLTNNWWKATMVVHSLHNADIEILSWSAPSPQSGNVGEPFQIAADEVKHNNGPQAAWSDVTWTAQEPQGGEVSARWIAQPGDTQPSDEVLQFQVDLTAISINLVLTRNLELTCNVAGGPYTVTLINDEWPINPDPPHERWEDPDPSDNTATFHLSVNCTQAAGQADVKVLDFWADPPWVFITQPWVWWEPIPVWEVKHNNGPDATWADVDWWVTGDWPQSPVDVRWMAQQGDICTYQGMPVDCQRGLVNPGQPNDGDINDLHFQVWLPVSTQVQLMRPIQFECKDMGVFVLTLWNYEYPVAPNEDPDPSNNLRSTDVTVYCGVPPQQADKQVLAVGWDISASDRNTTDPDLDIWISTDATISVSSTDVNMGPQPTNTLITFLANVPVGCEGRWLATTGDTLHEYEQYDPAYPLTQIHGYPHRPARVPGDGDPMYPPMRTAESALHFQAWEELLPATYTRSFELRCNVDGVHTFTFCNKAEVMAPNYDPIPADNWQCANLTVTSADCSSTVDTDGDTFKDNIECYLPTDQSDNCPDVIGVDDAWPLDINKNKLVNMADVNNFAGRIGATPASPMWLKRLDFNGNSLINMADVNMYAGKIGATCT